MRHTSTPPRERFIRVMRARFVGDHCGTCREDASTHTTVHVDGETETHCRSCACTTCGENDHTTRRTR